MCYQVFLEAIKNKEEGEDLQPKLRIITVIDGQIDFCKFEINLFAKNGSKSFYKVIRDGINELNKRTRPVYSGP